MAALCVRQALREGIILQVPGFFTRFSVTLLTLVAAALVPASAGAQASDADTMTPAWRSRLMPWETNVHHPRPWRRDPRLTGRAAQGFLDDFPVFFANPDSAQGSQHEVMWVRLIAYDARSDLFLGILLNQPKFLKSVVQGDNVNFRFDTRHNFLVAVAGPRYGEAGWPSTAAPTFFASLIEGIRAYRAGNDGHNMPGIERCISVLSPAIAAIPTAASHDERFVAHYVLGRCLAEKYETVRAIAQFKAALALDSSDVDTYLALLAEYSVMVHHRPGELGAEEEKHWEEAFVAHLARIRDRFGQHPDVVQVLALIFNPAHEAELDSTWQPHVAKLRRVGYAVFRWKQR